MGVMVDPTVPSQQIADQPFRLRVLLSYWYFKDADLDRLFAKHFTPPYPEVFADSGAFSAMTQGVAISIDEYAAWVERWRHLFVVYSNLDVIRNPQATWDNQMVLERRGLNPLPVFHVAEDWDWLERYLERYRYIALGVAGMSTDRYMPWLVQCFRRASQRSVFHGFGITSQLPIRVLPFHSVDSSSWGMGFRFGRVPLFDTRTKEFVKIDVGNHRSVYKHAQLIRDLGFEPEDFADRARYDRDLVAALSALTYMVAEQSYQGVHGHIPIPNDPTTPPGLKVYLADTSAGVNLGAADRGLKRHLAGLDHVRQERVDGRRGKRT